MTSLLGALVFTCTIDIRRNGVLSLVIGEGQLKIPFSISSENFVLTRWIIPVPASQGVWWQEARSDRGQDILLPGHAKLSCLAILYWFKIVWNNHIKHRRRQHTLVGYFQLEVKQMKAFGCWTINLTLGLWGGGGGVCVTKMALIL